MNELQNFIVKKGLEKASLGMIKQAIIEDSSLSSDTKEFWLGFIRGGSAAKDFYDLLELLIREK